MRARRHDARARGAAIHPRRPTRTRPTIRRAAHDGAARLRVLLPAPVRRHHEPQPARADRRTDPGIRRAADDLRPAASAPQRFHPAHPPQPTLRADQRGIPTGRLLHQDLHANRQPIPRRTRPHPPRGEPRPPVSPPNPHPKTAPPPPPDPPPPPPAEIANRSAIARTWRAYE